MSQQNCLAGKKFDISGIGDEQEMLPIPMRIEVTMDSIIIFPAESVRMYLLAFKILLSSCIRDEDSVLTSVSYDLILKDTEEKSLVMKLFFKDRKPEYFDLVYPDRPEIRRFYIKKE
jgi:hypothetical protein